jgi:hypothetical protein
VLDSEGADAMVVESATSGTPPAPKTQHRRAQAVRARETRANLIASWARAEEDAEAAVSWTHRILQDREARAAMTASLDLWTWPSGSQASEGHPDGGHGLHDTVVHPFARGGLQATGSAGGQEHDDMGLLGVSTDRSDSADDAAVHTMQQADAHSSPPVRVEPALEGGVGGGAWGPQDRGHGMALDSATNLVGAGVCARSDAGGLGSGQAGAGGAGRKAIASRLARQRKWAKKREHKASP